MADTRVIPEIFRLEGEEDGSWGSVLSRAAQNIVPSAKQFGRDIVQPILHPKETAKSMAQLGRGIMEKVIPGDQGWKGDEEIANAVGEFFVDRYGSMDAIKETIATDPVGIVADLGMVLSGAGAGVRGAGKVATVAAKAGSAQGRTGQALGAAGRAAETVGRGVGAVGRAIDPASLAGRGVKTVVQGAQVPGVGRVPGIGGPVSEIASGFAGRGAQSAREAARVGWGSKEVPGRKRVSINPFRGVSQDAQAFLRGRKLDMDDIDKVVSSARESISVMKQVKNDKWKAHLAKMGRAGAVTSEADFQKILDAVRKVRDTYKREHNGVMVDTQPTTQAMREKMVGIVERYHGFGDSPSNRAKWWSPEGLDDMRQEMRSVWENAPLTTTGQRSIRMGKEAEGAVGDAITKLYPDFAEMMKEYSGAADALKDIEKLMGGPAHKATVGHAFRTLQRNMTRDPDVASAIRSAELLAGAKHPIAPTMAGVALSPVLPQGLSGGFWRGATMATGDLGRAALSGGLASPRILGGAAYRGGQAARYAQDYGPDLSRLLRQGGLGASLTEEADRARERYWDRIDYQKQNRRQP
jgi:hypothetical protein